MGFIRMHLILKYVIFDLFNKVSLETEINKTTEEDGTFIIEEIQMNAIIIHLFGIIHFSI